MGVGHHDVALISGDKDKAATVRYRCDHLTALGDAAATCCDSTNNHDHRCATGLSMPAYHRSSLQWQSCTCTRSSIHLRLLLAHFVCSEEALQFGIAWQSTEIRLRDRLPKLQLIRTVIRRSRTENPIS
jgi:hypothetical protein